MITTPAFWYIAFWTGIAFWCFAYADKYPQYTYAFCVGGTILVLIAVLHSLGFIPK